MKLRNKKTGAIYSIEDIELGNNQDGIWLGLNKYTSLAELCADWEDLQEDKIYWYIDVDGEIMSKTMAWFNQSQDNIGNRFETREEAEKAVEKLKAWKRLKDKGFRFEGWDNTDRSTIHNFSLFVAIEDLENINRDLDLLFGGENE